MENNRKQLNHESSALVKHCIIGQHDVKHLSVCRLPFNLVSLFHSCGICTSPCRLQLADRASALRLLCWFPGLSLFICSNTDIKLGENNFGDFAPSMWNLLQTDLKIKELVSINDFENIQREPIVSLYSLQMFFMDLPGVSL